MECVTCVCVWLESGWEMLYVRGWGCVVGERIVLLVRGLSLGFTNPVGTWRKWDMCLCFGCFGMVGVGGRLGPESGCFVLMAGPGICILC